MKPKSDNLEEILDKYKDNLADKNASLKALTKLIQEEKREARIDELKDLMGNRWIRWVQGTAKLNPPTQQEIVYSEDIKNRIKALKDGSDAN